MNGENNMFENDSVQTETVTKEKSVKKEILEWILSILIAFVIAFVIRQFIFTVVKVEGASMEPTLHNADRLIVWRLAYTPDNEDIIVLHQEGNLPFIKRIIATEGQEINIDYRTHKVYVDGEELTETYIKEPTALMGDVTFPVVVPEGHVFVMGDNRNNSRDSRFSSVGMVAREDVLGKAVLRFFPFDKIGLLD